MDTMRILYPRYYPHVNTDCPEFPPMAMTRSCRFPGLMVEILHMITKELNMRIDPIAYGKPGETIDSDDMQDVLNYVHNASVDTFAMACFCNKMAVETTPERLLNFAFSKPLYKVRTKFLMRQSENIYSSIWSFFQIFDSRTWITILTALVMQLCLCAVIRQIEVQMSGAKHVGILESAWQMLRLQLLQPEKVFFTSKAGKMSIIFFSLIQCAVLLGVFSSWILSNILRPGHAVPADSIERLIEKISNREFTLVTSNMNSWFFEEVNKSHAFPYPELRTALQENPIKLTENFNHSLKKITKGRSVVFVQDDSETYLHSMTYCGLVELETDMPIVEAKLVFPRNTTLLEKVNRVIEENQMLILRLSRKYLDILKQMHRPSCKKSHQAIGIIPYIGVFIVCLLIIALSILVLLIEIVSNCNLRLQKTQPLVRHGSLKASYR